MREPVIDPVAEVLLDFQSTMAQFLELQISVIDAFAPRGRIGMAATPVAAPPAFMEQPTAGDALQGAPGVGRPEGGPQPMHHYQCITGGERPSGRSSGRQHRMF